MILTEENIKVTHEMMVESNMTKFGKYGVPVDPDKPELGLSWKNILSMSDEDFDKIEKYFLSKESKDSE